MRPVGQTLPIRYEGCSYIEGAFTGRNTHWKNTMDRTQGADSIYKPRSEAGSQQILPSQPWGETEPIYTLISDF